MIYMHRIFIIIVFSLGDLAWESEWILLESLMFICNLSSEPI